MTKALYVMSHDTARQRAQEAIAAAPDGYEVEIRPPKRNGDQNALLHALLNEIAATRQWAGKHLDAESWKRLLTAAWMRAEGGTVEIVPAIDGHGFDVLYRHTSQLTKGECASLIDYIQAWYAQQ